MGRPKEHGYATATALLDAAERALREGDLSALSVRALADEVGTTTRAVYSLFGSKDGLLVALGTRAFEMLGDGIRSLPESDDPAADLIKAGAELFRRFTREHPVLFRVAVQGEFVTPELRSRFDAARLDALEGLTVRMRRLEEASLLQSRTVAEATHIYHALCEGLASMDLRFEVPDSQQARLWHEAFSVLVAGLSQPAPGLGPPQRRRRPTIR